MSCTCTHVAICHRYLFGSGANTGECLAPECRCDHYEETA
jgi:hypothetical protein